MPDYDSKQLDVVLAELRLRWMAWLHLRRRALESFHAEIVQDASADLLQYLSGRGQRLHSEEEIRRIGFTILKRRVADVFRSQALRWAEAPQPDELPSSDPGADPERVLRYARLLRLVIGLVAKLDRPSRELLMRDSTIGAPNSPLSDAERQRLHRLRQQLRHEIKEIHGIDVKQYLGE